MKSIKKLFSIFFAVCCIAIVASACVANVSWEDPLPGSYISIELPTTQFGADDTVFVNISVGLYDWSRLGDADLSLPEGWNWIVMIHEHKKWDDYSNATILAVLDFTPEPLNKYGYTMVNGEIEYNYHENFDIPSGYFSDSEGGFAISLIKATSDLDDLSNLTYSFCMTQMLEYTKNEDEITLSTINEKQNSHYIENVGH